MEPMVKKSSYCFFSILCQYSFSQASTCLVELAFLSRKSRRAGGSYGGGRVHGSSSLGDSTIDSTMNFLHVPVAGHAIFSEHSSTALGGIVGLNFKSFAYSFST
ncbi:unnamed protein product [Prunus brigantina]